MALRARSLNPSDVWGGRDGPSPYRTGPVLRLPTTPPLGDGGQLIGSLADADGPRVRRLASTGDVTIDETWLRHIAEHDRRVGQQNPLWLVRRRPLAVETATDIVTRLARSVSDGALPARVLVEFPSAEVTELARLQAGADSIVRAPAGDRRLIVVAADATSADDVGRLVASGGGVGALKLSPARWGSWLGIREAARVAKEMDPALLTVVTDDRGSDVTRSVGAHLAAVTPAIDWYVSGASPEQWPTLLGRDAVDPPGGGNPGVVPPLDLGSLAAVADRLVIFPRGVTAPGEQPNDYRDHVLPGAPLGVPKQTVLETEALRRGLRTRRFTRQLFIAERADSDRVIGFSGPLSTRVGLASAELARHKGLTRDLLRAAGLPVAPGVWFGSADLDKVRAAADELGFPLVLKPVDGLKGRGIVPGVATAEELEDAFAEVTASGYGARGVVLERMVAGDEYRVLATRSEVLSVYRKEPASIVGDGRRTVEELVLEGNVMRRGNPHFCRRLIDLGNGADAVLRRQGLTRGSVPAHGRRVRLTAAGNLNLGGINREVLDATHPSLCDLAIKAVSAIPGLPHGGVDLFLADHTRAVDDQDVTIIEINHNPALLGHHFPVFGPARNVCGRLVEDAAAAAGLPLDPDSGRDVLTVHLTVVGKVQGVGFRQWLARAANQLQVDGWVANAADPDVLQAVAHGPAPRIGAMLRLAYGGPPQAEPREVLVEPIGTVPEAGFVVRAAPEGESRD